MSAPAPSKKKRTKGGRYSHEITKDEIEKLYHMPCEEASKQLGIGLTILKRICRRMGIEKWPYRQLKRAGKLGDAAAAAPAAGDGDGDGGQAAAPTSQPAPSAGPGGGASRQARPQQPRQEECAEGEEGDAGDSGSDDSGGSWQAAHRATAGGPVLPVVSMRRQGSEPLPPPPPPPPRQQPAAPPRRRAAQGSEALGRQLELGAAALQGSGPSPPEPPPLDMQRAPSGALKRIREEDLDPLLSLLDGSSPEPSPNPFAAAASLPEPAWEGGGGGAAAGPPSGASSLAASLNRLAMRTLSLKRQCSRDDTALDALDQALLAERLEAQAAAPAQAALGLGRACSMPTHGSLPSGSPQLARRGPPRQLPPGYAAYEQAPEVPRLPPRPPPGGSPFAAAAGAGGVPMVEEALESQLPLMSDRSFNALLFGREGATPPHDISLEALVAEANAGAAAAQLPMGDATSAGSARGSGGGGGGLPPREAHAQLAHGRGGGEGVASLASPHDGLAGDWTDSLPGLHSPFGAAPDEGTTTQQDVDDLLAEFLGQEQPGTASGRSPGPANPAAGAQAPADGPPPSAFAAAAAEGGGEVDVMQLASQLVSDPDPVKQMLASRLLQMHQQQQQQAAAAAAAAAQQQQQQRQLLAQHAAQQQVLAHVRAAAAAAGQQPSPPPAQQQQQPGAWAAGDAPRAPSPQLLELQSAVQHAQQLQAACLQQRQTVREMLEQRGVSPSRLATDPEGLAQLTRLKQLKEALQAAQARLAALRSAAAAAPPLARLPPAFGSTPPLGPAPPLPPLQKESSIAALYTQWQGEESLGLDALHKGRWEGAAQASWGVAAAAAAPPAFVAVPQHAVLAQRAASAPLPYDLDWTAIL